MYKAFSLVLLTAVFPFINAQKLSKDNVIGFWKLKESGFYENNRKVVKDFDNCRLMRNYAIRADGFAVYNYTEGSVGDCSPSEPRLSFWRIVDNRIQFYVDDNNILEEVVVTFNKDKTMTLSDYKPEYVKMKGDALTEKVMNTIHYDILERQY
ncbi:lipocalin family protein [Chryseobacterium sp. Mn2064]|uniref:lipocalin family protein n=1 Tax=Chryseobacterium sp. Mn2064 TaxID=3395263 RepID=UPI003BDF1B8B